MAELPDEMVERAARSLYNGSASYSGVEDWWAQASADNQDGYREVARAVLTAALAGCVRETWGIRVDVEHPRRKERVGDIMTHHGEEKSRRCHEVWSGWTPVSRTTVHYAGPWVDRIADSTPPPSPEGIAP